MPDLPSGTITFLFTDIEGSTKLWEKHGSAMQTALARHDAILGHSIETRGGAIFKTVGDAFCAAFATAADAVGAAVAAQEGLAAETWHDITPIRARMALHTGTAQIRDNDYFGPSLNRVARLLSAGHGGQILLSHAAYALAHDFLSPEFTFQDMGEHRLKDLMRPEHIFQLLHPSLRAEFPALKTLDQCPNNLPAQSTRLVGRETTVADILTILRSNDARLLTLTGPGGAGKTRLALHIAAEMLDDCGQGVFFIPLAPLSNAALVVSEVAQALGVVERSDQSLSATVQGYVGQQQILLVFDNFEHVLDAASLVSELLAACPHLKALVTSRTVLRLRGEREFVVPPLALPRRKPPPAVETLSQYGAVQLFIERAQAVKPDFDVTSQSAPAIAEICVRLDGLPLAIELAAVRIKLFSPIALLARLENRLNLLTGGARDLPARHQTLRGAIAWSYELLDDSEKSLFRQISVFAGGCDIEAVEAIFRATDDPAAGDFNVLEGLSSLLDNSLLQQEEDASGEPRFTMLETLCEFAGERLVESGERPQVLQRHAHYYMTFTEAVNKEGNVADATHRLRQLRIIAREHANIQAALAWSEQNDCDCALRLVAAWFSGAPSERGEAAERALHAAAQSLEAFSDELVSEVLGAAANYAGWRGDFARQKALTVQRLDHMRRLNNPLQIAWSLHTLGFHAWILGENEEAIRYFRESIALFLSQGAVLPMAWTLLHIACAHTNKQESAAARECLEQARSLFQQHQDRDGEASALAELANLSRRQGDLGTAKTLFEQMTRIESELEDHRLHPWRLYQMGWLAMLEGNYAAADSHLRQSLRAFDETQGAVGENKRVGVLHALMVLGCLAGRTGQWERAAKLLGAEAAQREDLHLPMPMDASQEHRRCVDTGRSALGEQAWDTHLQEGRLLTRAGSIAYALGEETS